jgi:pimeloyl-ACP methyl ester carboxylesterase
VSTPISVSGGTGGIAARYDDMYSVAHVLEDGAADLAQIGVGLAGLLADAAVPLSAVLDPVGAGRVEFALAAVLADLAGSAIRAGALASALTAAATAYRAADDLSRDFVPDLQTLARLPAAVVTAAATAVSTGRPGRAAQRLGTADPQLLDVMQRALARAGGTSPDGLHRQLSRLFDDGHPVVRATGLDPADHTPPRSLHDLIAQLAHRNDGADGEISVSFIGPPGPGPRPVIVDIPGTKDWSLNRVNPNVANVGSDVRAVEGDDNTYAQGVLAAMKDAGVRPDDNVLLVGHSLGGLVAVNVAASAALSRAFTINHVVTAGAPIGSTVSRLPRSVSVLALENAGDVVPHLDAANNPDRPSVTTVEVNHNAGDIGANHNLTASYVPGAADIDASHNASTRAYLDAISPFLTGDAIATHTYVVSRAQ